MKKKIALALSLLLVGALFGGCGIEQEVVVDENLTSKVTVGFYLTEEEAMMLGGEADLSGYKKVEKDKKTYYLNEQSQTFTHEEFENQIGRLDEKCFVAYGNDIAKDSEVGSSISESELQEIYDTIEFCDMTYTLPFTIAKSSASDVKGNTMVLHKDEALGTPVVYAVSDPAILDGTNLAISGAAGGGVYNKKKTITVTTTDGVIKSRTVTINGTADTFSDDTHPYNVNVCSADGKYVITAELFSGVKKTIKFTVDRTKPKANVANNKTYKSGKKITFSDKTSGIKSAKLDNKTVKSGTAVKKKGTHKLVLTDKAGNKVTIKFKIK